MEIARLRSHEMERLRSHETERLREMVNSDSGEMGLILRMHLGHYIFSIFSLTKKLPGHNVPIFDTFSNDTRTLSACVSAFLPQTLSFFLSILPALYIMQFNFQKHPVPAIPQLKLHCAPSPNFIVLLHQTLSQCSPPRLPLSMPMVKRW